MKKTYRVFNSKKYQNMRIGGVAGLGVCTYICLTESHSIPSLQWMFLALLITLWLGMGFAYITWSARVGFASEGIYFGFPLPFFRKAFLPWERIQVLGCLNTKIPDDAPYVYLSSSPEEVMQLESTLNFTRLLYTRSNTVFFTSNKAILASLKEHLPDDQYIAITAQLSQM